MERISNCSLIWREYQIVVLNKLLKRKNIPLETQFDYLLF